MQSKKLTEEWFRCWEKGDYLSIPVSDDFSHTSPYGTIEGKSEYLKIVEANKEKFLGNTIEVRDSIYSANKACVRYRLRNPDFSMEVSEWIYISSGLISRIVSYYHIGGEISEERKLTK